MQAHRMREYMYFHDPPEYYTEGRYISFDITAPEVRSIHMSQWQPLIRWACYRQAEESSRHVCRLGQFV